MVRPAGLVVGGLAVVLAVPGCATAPDSPTGTGERAQRMKADCERRGGIWYPVERSCAGADPLPR